jgi:hypothetical protein
LRIGDGGAESSGKAPASIFGSGCYKKEVWAYYEHVIGIASSGHLPFGYDYLRDGFGYWLLGRLGDLRGKTTRRDRQRVAVSFALSCGNVDALFSVAHQQDVETGNFGRLLHGSFLRRVGGLFSDIQLLAVRARADPHAAANWRLNGDESAQTAGSKGRDRGG